MKKNILFVIFIILFFGLVSPNIVLADNYKDTFCPLCVHRDDDDPLYKKERQFYQKVKILTDIYGDRIDPVVLTATVVHRYSSADYAYAGEYDEDFDEGEYKNRNSLLSSLSGSSNSDNLSDEEKALVEANEKYDLLTLASLVMADSNNGNYTDVCYKDALSGNKLVGNKDSDAIWSDLVNNLINNFTCFKVSIEGTDSYFGDSTKVADLTEKKRLNNIDKVCKEGYVGGLYNGVSKIKDKEKKELTKKYYAQQIIDYANYFKRLYGTLEEDQVQCSTNTSSVTGEFANWKQTDSEWGSIPLGGSSSMSKIGCLITSIAIQIARSGTQIGTLPNGFSSFNPGAFVTSLNENGGFVGGGNFAWKGQTVIAPNWEFGEYKSVNISDNKKLADTLSKELSGGNKYIVIQIKHSKSSQHWIAVDSVSNGEVTLFDPGAKGTTLDENYTSWVVQGYRVMYARDATGGQTSSSNNNLCVNSGGASLNRFLAFLTVLESSENPETCNFQGQGEGTGYLATTTPGDAGGQTSAFGITASDEDIANSIGYTSFLSELYSGCTEKSKTEQLFIGYVKNGIDNAEQLANQYGVSLNEQEKYSIASVNFGGTALANPILEAIKTYGKNSEQVFDAFKNSFGINYAISNGFHGLMRRRLDEYEIFMTGNFEADSTKYLQMPYIQNGLAMSKSEVMSHWPTKRDELLEGLPFAPIDKNSTTTARTSSSSSSKSGSSTSSPTAACLKKGKKNKVLFVGNSVTFVADIPSKFGDYARSKGYKLDVTAATQGGIGLTELYDGYTDIISNYYDCIVMQENAATYIDMGDYDKFLRGANEIIASVKKHNPNVVAYIRQTWGYTSTPKDRMKERYELAEKVAKASKSYIIPDGKAFDASMTKYPSIQLFGDERHQNEEGAYLSAATIFKVVSGESPVGSKYYAGVDKNDAIKLQKIADEVAAGGTVYNSGDLICVNGDAVYKDDSSSSSTSSSSSSGLKGVVECAKKQLGKPYNHGGQGPDEFDCSGLTYYCYKEALGVDITAGSALQWDDTDHFTNVSSIDELVPGDIIASRGGGHVSIYIGDGEVIHASNYGIGVIQSPASQHTPPILYKHYKG